MFATGSHDGGVRVWTRRPDHHNANAFFPPRSASGSSPYGMPVGSTAFESALSLDEYHSHSENNSSPAASQTRLTSTSGRDYPP